MPRIGAVVVFKKHGSMSHGHVAVVTRVVNSREVLVDHANWAPHRGRGRGQISKMVAVTDVSPRNDWTEVRVWNVATQDFGTRTYPTYGFIYPGSPRSHVMQAAWTPPHDVAPVVAMKQLASPAECRPATVDPQLVVAIADAVASDPKPLATGQAKDPVKTVEAVKAEAPQPPHAEPARPVMVARNEVPVVATPPRVASPAAPPTAAAVPMANAEAVWEDDAAMAKRFGSQHY